MMGKLLTAIDVGGTECSRTKHTYLQSGEILYFKFTENLFSRDRGGGAKRGRERKIKPTSTDPDAGETLSDLLFRAACNGQC